MKVRGGLLAVPKGACCRGCLGAVSLPVPLGLRFPRKSFLLLSHPEPQEGPQHPQRCGRQGRSHPCGAELGLLGAPPALLLLVGAKLLVWGAWARQEGGWQG